MSLADLAIRNAKPGERPVKLFDERGLYLQLNPNGRLANSGFNQEAPICSLPSPKTGALNRW
ncbi:MAG: Arm DNA-binding domain-containing protein [Candidatus Contendobacter sp.]|nr:Arm DNA-binding domain-containing protein [Candidatus Contendobacter sp.]